MLHEYLSKLDQLIDLDHLARAEERVMAATSYEPVDRLPTVVFCGVDGWPAISYREAFHDVEKMLLSELNQSWVGAHVKDDRMFTIRANYGVGIVATMFGCRLSITDDNIMPWFHPLSDEDLDAVLDAGPVDIGAGLGSRVMETERFYIQTLSNYERLPKAVHIYLCDIQGPFDVAHLVMGTRIYTDIYDNPDRVHRLLELTTDACARFTQAQKKIIGEGSDVSFHSQVKLRGAVRLCDDTSINLSRDSYREFCKPYNQRLFASVGGGWIHYCGNGKQILPEVLTTDGLTGINFGNPEMQNVEQVLNEAAPEKIALLLWPAAHPLPDWVETGVTLTTSGPDVETARRMFR